MKTITQYESVDGTKFNTEAECRKHDRLVLDCRKAIVALGPQRNIASHQYIQHDREVALQAKRNVLAIMRREWSVGNYPVFNSPDDDIHPHSFVGRLAC